MQSISSPMPAQTLLLDECVCAKIIERQDKYEGKICTSVTLLGRGATDEEIREYAKASGDIIVTKDWGMIRECLEQNLKMAIYFRGKAYQISLDSVHDLTEGETETPVFSRKKQIKRIQPTMLGQCWRGYASLLPIMPMTFCVCGQFCYGENRLRNHIKNSHNVIMSHT